MPSAAATTAAAPRANQRLELAKLCSGRHWSKAIRVLDSLLSSSPSIQDICNRAFCYSQLELHKHVIKDCDKALELDPTLLQAYILKGNALLSLGKKEDAYLVWDLGYKNAVQGSSDLKQLLELEELLGDAKQNVPMAQEELEKIKDSSSEIPVTRIKAVDCEEHIMEPNSVTSAPVTNNVSSEEHALNSSGIITTNSGMGSKISGSKHDIFIQSSDTAETGNGSNTFKMGRKVYLAEKSKTVSISLDVRLSRGIAEVNEGNYDQAITIFDQILRETPIYPEALIGRGTAHAFQRELNAAIADFTKAIEANPSAGEAWKRRGQARAALGESLEAVEDLTKALEFEPNSPDILHERGIVSFKFKDFVAAVRDLSACVLRDKKNKSAYTYLGLALSAIGEYSQAEEAHQKAIQLDENFLEGWTHLAQFYQELANPEKSLRCLDHVLLVDTRFAKAYHLRGLLYHGMGQHRIAVKDLSLGLSIESTNIECLYLRASCYHAIGEYGDAVKDYDAVLALELDSLDKFILQCLAFYQKEIALYTASKANSEFDWFNIDRDVDSLFKEYWCKRLHPKYVCERVFRQPPLRDSLKKGRLRKQDFTLTKHKANLLQAADLIGQKIQYDSPGFLPNRRQYRMAGLAAIEIAQKVARAWRSLRNLNKHGKKPRKREKNSLGSQNRGGAGCSSNSFSETSTTSGFTEDRSATHCSLSWKDIYSIAVKWRQISEPCDPVVWINNLSETFGSGFGSNTPMILGQAKVVRYFPNYKRMLNIAKSTIRIKKHVKNSEDSIIDLSEDGKLQKIMHAQSCSDLHNIIGEDFWVATSYDSTAVEGKRLEGTRITVQKMDSRGFDFAIRTPCPPSRWEEYDAEMTTAWEALCKESCGEAYSSNDLSKLENLKDVILRMTYYWYNFMPLSRGSAVVGYTVLLGLFLAANMDVRGSIPPGVQVDWEAILSPNPDLFLDAIKGWLYPSIRYSTAWKDYPDVASTLSTTGSVVAALSSYDV